MEAIVILGALAGLGYAAVLRVIVEGARERPADARDPS